MASRFLGGFVRSGGSKDLNLLARKNGVCLDHGVLTLKNEGSMFIVGNFTSSSINTRDIQSHLITENSNYEYMPKAQHFVFSKKMFIIPPSEFKQSLAINNYIENNFQVFLILLKNRAPEALKLELIEKYPELISFILDKT